MIRKLNEFFKLHRLDVINMQTDPYVCKVICRDVHGQLYMAYVDVIKRDSKMEIGEVRLKHLVEEREGILIE